MTLVCSPHHSMPSDIFGSGLEILPPHLTMNPHQFSDPNWSHQSPFLFPSYEEKPQTPSYTNSQDVHPSSVPEYHQPTYPTTHRPPPIQVASTPNNVAHISRPKSSPSTFGPSVEDLFSNNPFKSKNDEYPPAIFALTPHSGQIPGSTMTSPYYPSSEFPTPNPAHSPNLARPIPIAPDPAGVNNVRSMKRAREDDETSDFGQKRRKRAPSQSGPIELSGEEQLLLRLKEEENLPWKDIAIRFQTDLGKTFQVPALQMRFKRLRERMRTWTENDVQALEQAYEYWEKFQYDIIAAKMLDFGASERWPAKYCARKWEELHPYRTNYNTQPHYLRDPWDNTTSPVASSLGHLSPRAGTL